MSEWFTVDREGLAQLQAGRDPAFVVYELVSNAWDQTVTTVDIQIAAQDKAVLVRIEDDDPNGFSDLAHAYTLFAPSSKKGDKSKRGRFNLGEKLVLALATEATIASTKGTVIFDADGRRDSDERRDKGSVFTAVLRIDPKHVKDMVKACMRLIPPAGVVTTVNGDVLPQREAVRTFQVSLPTVIEDANGVPRTTSRKTTVSLYDALPGEKASIYEMGIPVVETGDRWHADIAQRIPLNKDRDNVTPAYLRALRTHVANHTTDLITTEDANAAWARDALEDDAIKSDAVKAIVKARFGDMAVAFDPTDLEANKLAAAQGYTVVGGRSLSKDSWSNVKEAGLLPAAGKVTPSPKVTMDKAKPFPESEWTESQKAVVNYAAAVGTFLLDRPVTAALAKKPRDAEQGCSFHAWYTAATAQVTFNLTALGKKWFDKPDQRKIDALLLHEFAHAFSGDHLSHKYYDALCDLGAKLRSCDIQIGVEQ